MEDDKQVDVAKPKCGLLALLPKPKQQIQVKGKPASVMLPAAMQKINQPVEKKEPPVVKPPAPKTSAPKRLLVDYGSSGSDSGEDDGDGSADFFGIKSAKISKVEAPWTASQLIHDVELGPSRPDAQDYDYQEDEISDEDDTGAPTTSRLISDQVANEMIYNKELAPFGASSMAAREAVMNMIDVSVDKVLGPHIQENLLKNLNNKTMAQVSIGPLPKVKRDPKDRLSKMKHQITYLAGQAVAREEQLQEKWAENRAKKKQSSQRYGF